MSGQGFFTAVNLAIKIALERRLLPSNYSFIQIDKQ